MRGADRDYAVGISRIGDADAAITFLRTCGGDEVKVTVVTRGSDDDGAGAHHAVCFFTNRSAAAGIVGYVVTDRQT